MFTPMYLTTDNIIFFESLGGPSSLKKDLFKLGIGTKGRIGVEEDLDDPGLTSD